MRNKKVINLARNLHFHKRKPQRTLRRQISVFFPDCSVENTIEEIIFYKMKIHQVLNRLKISMTREELRKKEQFYKSALRE
jgi:hypothetical protein